MHMPPDRYIPQSCTFNHLTVPKRDVPSSDRLNDPFTFNTFWPQQDNLHHQIIPLSETLKTPGPLSAAPTAPRRVEQGNHRLLPVGKKANNHN